MYNFNQMQRRKPNLIDFLDRYEQLSMAKVRNMTQTLAAVVMLLYLPDVQHSRHERYHPHCMKQERSQRSTLIHERHRGGQHSHEGQLQLRHPKPLRDGLLLKIQTFISKKME